MEQENLKETLKQWYGTLQGYWFGFGSSLLLTLSSFFLVYFHFDIPESTLIATLIGLAVVQAAAQLIFFLHVGEEPHPRWESLIFAFMVLMLLIVVLGSLWIMYNLDYRVMRM